jgi:hypothetical protein
MTLFQTHVSGSLEFDQLRMTRAEILDLVQGGAANPALPRVVTAPCLIVAVRLSRCCNARSILVRSRPGGFIAQDCLNCGQKSDYVRENDMPDLDCEGCCRLRREREVEPRIRENNYWYECTGCRRTWKIGSIAPIWSNTFEYAGLAAPGDVGFRR